MATIYRKVYPVPMPDGAVITTRRGQRLANLARLPADAVLSLPLAMAVNHVARLP